jgi:putative hemolysin
MDANIPRDTFDERMKRSVDPAELAKASHMRPGDPRVGLLMEVSGLKKLDRFYGDIEHLEDLDFVDAVFRNLDLRIEVPLKDLENIPAHGGVVLVANHPYGAMDGLALLATVGRRRGDLKAMANFLLQQLPPLSERIIGVNPFEQLRSLSSYQGMRQATAHVRAGGALGIFPAGEVSSFRTEVKAVADTRWRAPVIKLIRNAGVPVVPVWFDGANSLVFHVLGMIHPNLRTLRLPKEMMRMRGRTVRMRIGKPIPASEIAAFSSIEQLGRFLRARTYALGSGLRVKREFFERLRVQKRPREVVAPEPREQLLRELDGLADAKLSSQGEFDLYLASSHRIPAMLREIGRLRELAFRAVGEGTNKAIDLDEYDLYYDHLFLWDRESEQLAGAYRIGDGARIMARYGKRGFYLYSLFRMDRAMDKLLASSFELGRSFVMPAYQRHRLPLYMLWRGLLLHITSHPQHRYLVGPVSISSTYSRFSRALIMEYLRQNHFEPELAAHVRPRNRFRVRSEKADPEVLVQASGADLKRMDRLIAEVDPREKGMPVLLRKYLSLNGRIIGFNRDPRFNDALDALLVLDLERVPPQVIQDLQRGMDQAGTTS